MSWEFWLQIGIQALTLIAFVITARFYYNQNNILTKNAKTQNFYTLMKFLDDISFFKDLSVLAQIKETGSPSTHFENIYRIADLIVYQLKEGKLDEKMFNIILEKNIFPLSEFIFDDSKDVSIQKLKEEYKQSYPHLFNFYTKKQNR